MSPFQTLEIVDYLLKKRLTAIDCKKVTHSVSCGKAAV